jgi:hypothetical protein
VFVPCSSAFQIAQLTWFSHTLTEWPLLAMDMAGRELQEGFTITTVCCFAFAFLMSDW